MQTPLFTPIQVGGITLPNRIAVSPMCQYSADDGAMNDWHLAHLASMACSGAGLVMVEATGVTASGELRKTTWTLIAEAGDGRKRLAAAGLTITAFGEDVRVAAVRFGSRARKSGFQQGFEVAAVKVPTARPSEHWVYIPALALIAFVYFWQRRRGEGSRRR